MGKLGYVILAGNYRRVPNYSKRGAINRFLQREMFIENIKFLIPYQSLWTVRERRIFLSTAIEFGWFDWWALIDNMRTNFNVIKDASHSIVYLISIAGSDGVT